MNISDIVTSKPDDEDVYVSGLLSDPDEFERKWAIATPHNKTLFMYAAEKSNLVLCKKLDTKLASLGGNLRAVFLGRAIPTIPPITTVDFIARVLEKGRRNDDIFKIACIYFKHGGKLDTEKRYSNGMTLAHLVCLITNLNSLSKLETLSYIFELDPDAVNKQDKLGDTPLHYALRPLISNPAFSHLSVESTARVLVHHRANIRLKNIARKSPLLIAKESGNVSIVSILAGFKREVYSTLFTDHPPNGVRFVYPGEPVVNDSEEEEKEKEDPGNEQRMCTVSYVHTDHEEENDDEDSNYYNARESTIGSMIHIRFNRTVVFNGKIMFFVPFNIKEECYFPAIDQPFNASFNVPFVESGVYVLVDCRYYNVILDLARDNHIVCLAKFSNNKKVAKADYYKTVMEMARSQDPRFVLKVAYVPRSKDSKVKRMLLGKMTSDYKLPTTHLKRAKNGTYLFSVSTGPLLSYKGAFLSDATFKYGITEGLYVDLSSSAIKAFVTSVSKSTTMTLKRDQSDSEDDESEDEKGTKLSVEYTSHEDDQEEPTSIDDDNSNAAGGIEGENDEMQVDIDDQMSTNIDSGNESDPSFSSSPNVEYDSMEEYT